jgi:hypothetical protein
MIRKSLLHSVVFLFIGILTACAPVETTPLAPGMETSSSPSVSSGTTLIVFLGLIALTAILFYTVLGRKKTGTGSPTNTASKNIGSDHLTEDHPKPVLAKPTVADKSSAPKITTSDHIFISYRRSDSADIAGRIYDRLTGRFGRNPIFKDVDSIPLGLDFKEYLDAKVSECSVLLAIIGDRWLDASDEMGKLRLDDPTDFVRIELESALARGIPVIPLLVRGVRMPAEDKLPASLKRLAYRNGISIRPDPDFHRDMDRLISALEKYIQ